MAIAERLVAGEGWSGCRRPSPGRPRWSWSPTPRRRSTYAAIDLVVQAEHGPDGLAYLITWSEAAADAITEEVARLTDASPRRAEILATLERGGYAVLVDGPEQAMAVANVIAPEHLELLNDDPESLVPLDPQRRRGVPRPVGPGQRRRLHRRPQPRAADRPLGPLRERPAGRRLSQAHPRASASTATGCRRLAPHVVALAASEGLAAHADSVRIRAGPGTPA